MAIKRIKDLNSILKDDSADMSTDIHFPEYPANMQSSMTSDELKKMSSFEDNSKDVVNYYLSFMLQCGTKMLT